MIKGRSCDILGIFERNTNWEKGIKTTKQELGKKASRKKHRSTNVKKREDFKGMVTCQKLYRSKCIMYVCFWRATICWFRETHFYPGDESKAWDSSGWMGVRVKQEVWENDVRGTNETKRIRDQVFVSAQHFLRTKLSYSSPSSSPCSICKWGMTLEVSMHFPVSAI